MKHANLKNIFNPFLLLTYWTGVAHLQSVVSHPHIKRRMLNKLQAIWKQNMYQDFLIWDYNINSGMLQSIFKLALFCQSR